MVSELCGKVKILPVTTYLFLMSMLIRSTINPLLFMQSSQDFLPKNKCCKAKTVLNSFKLF